MAKAKKKRADKYEAPLKIKGSFGDVIKVAMTPKTNIMTEFQKEIIDLIKQESFMDIKEDHVVSPEFIAKHYANKKSDVKTALSNLEGSKVTGGLDGSIIVPRRYFD